MEYGLLGLVILALDICALIGLVVWFLAGPRGSRATAL